VSIGKVFLPGILVKHGERVNTVIRLLAGQPRNFDEFLGGKRGFFSLSKAPRRAVGSLSLQFIHLLLYFQYIHIQVKYHISGNSHSCCKISVRITNVK
jgi:hypothetical protein